MNLGKVIANALSSQATEHKRTVPIHVNDMMETALFEFHPQMDYYSFIDSQSL